MNITLKQREIEVALRRYIASLGIDAEIDDVEFTAGRGAAGITAEISIGGLTDDDEDDSAGDKEPEPSKPTPKAKPFGKAKPTAKDKPVPQKTEEPETKASEPEKGDADETPDTGEDDENVDGPLETEDEKEEAEASAKTEAPPKGKSLFGGK